MLVGISPLALSQIRFSRKLVSLLSAISLIFIASSALLGQISSQTGALRGSVSDPSGAVVNGAKVVLVNQAGTTQVKTTSADGSFVFPLLDPGEYSLSVEAKGFQRAVYNKVLVQITQVTNIPVLLQVGTESTEVTVSAELAPIVNTVNPTLGDVINSSVVSNLPLPTRNFTGLLALNPATSSALPSAATAGRASSTVFVAGMRGTFNNLVINGIDANNYGNNNFGSVAIPSPDTIEEFRVQTSLYDASQGKTSGGNINVITKSGGPTYHGELYEFFRNEKLNANDWFFNHIGNKRPVLRQNQFGGNFGGPIPHAGKTYFFGSYQGTRQLNGVSSSITEKWPVIPATRSQSAIESAFGLGPGTLNPVALKLLQAPGQFGGFLIPTGAGAAAGQVGQVAISKPLKFNDNQFNSNLDHWFGDNHHLAAKFFYAQGQTFDPLGGSDTRSFGSGETDPVHNRLASVTHTWVISSRMINEARVGFNRVVTARQAVEPLKVSDIGMTRFNSSIFPGIPDMFTADLNPSFGGITTNADQASHSNTYHFSDTLAYTRGAHALRFGFETRRYQINLFNNFASRGFIQFVTFKDFLQGNVFDTFVGTGQTDRGFRARDISTYVQDDWKATGRLTLNLGVRWDYLGPSVDVKDRLGNFDPSRLDAATLANGGPGLLNGFVLPASANFGAIKGTPGVDRSTLKDLDYNNFAPRVGFAYDLRGDGKTAIRGGYGIYYIRISNQMLLQLITAAPFFQLSRVTSTSALGRSLANPYPALPLPAAFPIFPTPPSLTGLAASGAPQFSAPLITLNPFERDMKTPYAQHWNFTVEQDLGKGYSLQLGYLGSKGTRLLFGRQVNQAMLANATAPIRGITVDNSSNANARVPVIGFSSTGLNDVTDEGFSNYHALIAGVSHKVGSLYLNANYTWSKALDNNSGSDTQDLGSSAGNQLDLRNTHGLSNFDRTHRFQVSYTYAIPGFKAGGLRYLLGGWGLGGLTTIQTGLPITFTCGSCGSNVFGQASGTILPNALGDLSNLYKSGSIQKNIDGTVINTNLFGVPAGVSAGSSVSGLNALGGPGNQTFTVGPTGTGIFFGNLRRNPGPHGPNQQQWDFFVSKDIPLFESLHLNWRTEFFNVFNHPSFNRPNGVVGGSAFGTISSTVSDPRIIQMALKLQF